MGEVRNIKYEIRTVGLKMDHLVKKVQKKYNERHGFEPPYYVVLDWIAVAVEKKGLNIE